MSSKETRQDKLKMLKGILNGTFDFKILKPPKHYFADQLHSDNGDYHVSSYGMDLVTLKADEFEPWCQANVREIDTLIIWKNSRENEPIHDPDIITEPSWKKDQAVIMLPRIEEPRIIEITSIPSGYIPPERHYTKEDTQASDEPVIDIQADQPSQSIKLKIDELPEEKPLPVKPRSGKLSEYGITWGLDEEMVKIIKTYKN